MINPLHRGLWTVSAAIVLLSGCGGGGDDGPVVSTGATGRGSLVTVPRVVDELKVRDIDDAAGLIGASRLIGRARCDVRVVALDYNTVGVNGEGTNASGVLLVPAGPCAQESHPLVSYSRGTTTDKNKTLANVKDSETLLLIAFFASQGYAVVASDYLGYARSAYPFHPYLHAQSQATTTVDAIRAARAAASGQSLRLSGKVMLTGYSQGGHASAATQRAIESTLAEEFNVVAGAHLAGPYNISGALRERNAFNSYQFFVPFLVTSWQRIYGGIYQTPTQVFRDPYAANIENLLPSATLNNETLVSSGALPGGTPTQARDALIQPTYLADVQANENNALVRAARLNDVLGWSPRARTLLCGARDDPTVPPAVHQSVALADFARRGVSTVSSVDVDAQIRSVFAPGGVAPTDPSSRDFTSYYNSYHAIYQPPFCLAQAKAFFDPVR